MLSRNFTALELQFHQFNNWHWYVLLHNINDLPDASSSHIADIVGMKNQEKILRSQHFTRPNTKLSPCWKYKEKSCNEVFLHQKIAKDFNCQVPILYTGMHLDSLDLEDLPICNKTVSLHMMLMDTKDSTCSKSIPCEHTGGFFLWFWLAHILFPESSWHRITVLLTFFKAE